MTPIQEIRAMLAANPPTAGTFAERRARWEPLYQKICPAPEGTRTAPLPGLAGEWVWGPGVADGPNVLVYLHGGGFTAGSAAAYRGLSSRLGTAAGCRVIVPDYRHAPEQPFPAALDDCIAAYRWLVGQGGAAPRDVALAGDSAGGNLVLAMLVALRDAGDPLPACGVSMSGIFDLGLTGESVSARAQRDPCILPSSLRACSAAYLGAADPKTPLASPLYAALHGLPPLLIQCGSEEMLRDDSVRLVTRLKMAGVDATLEEWPEMIHVFHLFADRLPEGRQGIERVGAFVRQHLAASRVI